MKRFLSVLLSAGILAGLLSGCTSGGSGDKPTGEVPMGRYVETQGEILENVTQVYDLKPTDGGGMTFFGRTSLDDVSGASDYRLYTVPAGDGAITSEEVPGLGEFAPKGVRGMARGGDGTLYILYYPDDTFRMQAAKSLNGGPFEPIVVADLAAAPGGVSIGGGTSIGGSISMSGGEVQVTAPETPGADTEDDGARDAISFDSIGAASGEMPTSAEGDTAASDTDDIKVEGSKGGTFNFSEGDMPAKMPSGILALDEGGFIVLYGDKGASRYSADGTLQAEYAGNSYSSNPLVLGNTFLITGADGATLWSYDLSTGKQNGTYSYEKMSFGVKAAMDSENIYLADSTGIYRQAKGGTQWEKQVEGDLTSLVMPNLNITGFVPDGAGGYLALLGSEKSVQLMRYAYSETTPTNPDTELTIFSLKNNSTIRQAIGEFQRRNPNVRVNFRVGLDDSGAATAEDVIRTLNTEFLAGKGPDLLLLDGLPVDSYIEKGVLADITDLITSQSDLLSNLTNAYEKDGKHYGVPSRFTFPVMMGKGADVDGMSSLDALLARVKAEQGGDPAFLRVSEDLWRENGVGIMMDFYDVCAGSWTKEDGAIDQAALAAFLSAMTELDKTMKEHTPQLGDGSVGFVTMAIAATGGAAGFEEINMGPSDLKAGKAIFHTQEMAGVFGLNFVSQNLGDMEGAKMNTLFGGGAYTPKGGVGLNAAGKQQELAKSFIEMLLSQTVQDSYLYDGYPVNGKSLDKLVADTLKDNENGDMGFVALCGKLNTPLLSDQVIRDAVQAQMKGLMDGSTTPDQAAANVVEKTQIYLAE